MTAATPVIRRGTQLRKDAEEIQFYLVGNRRLHLLHCAEASSATWHKAFRCYKADPAGLWK